MAVTGAVVAWLVVDLREKGMLGDSGANMLGAVLGIYMVFLLDLPGRITVIVVLALLTLASERWSFSKAIDRSPRCAGSTGWAGCSRGAKHLFAP